MTVERLIELLQEQYPQALVLIESDMAIRLSPYPVPEECCVLEPYRLRPLNRDGRVYIICEHHDC